MKPLCDYSIIIVKVFRTHKEATSAEEEDALTYVRLNIDEHEKTKKRNLEFLLQ